MSKDARSASAPRRDRHPTLGLMVAHEFLTDPFKIVHFDHVGPFPPSTSENKYVLTIIDRGTGWPELIPVPDVTAVQTAKALWEQWICRTVSNTIRYRSASFFHFNLDEGPAQTLWNHGSKDSCLPASG